MGSPGGLDMSYVIKRGVHVDISHWTIKKWTCNQQRWGKYRWSNFVSKGDFLEFSFDVLNPLED